MKGARNNKYMQEQHAYTYRKNFTEITIRNLQHTLVSKCQQQHRKILVCKHTCWKTLDFILFGDNRGFSCINSNYYSITLEFQK